MRKILTCPMFMNVLGSVIAVLRQAPTLKGLIFCILRTMNIGASWTDLQHAVTRPIMGGSGESWKWEPLDSILPSFLSELYK